MKNIVLSISAILLAALAFAVWLYFPQGSAPAGDPSLSRVKSKGTLVVGSDIPYGVMEFFGENNQPTGIDIDIVRSIAKSLGVTLQVKPYSWDSLFTALNNGEIDLVASSVTITPDRAKTMLFTIPYFNGGQSIIIRKNEKNIRSMTDLKNKRIGSQIDTTGAEHAKTHTENVKTYSIVETEIGNKKEGLVYDLVNGSLDAAIIDYIAAITIVQKNPSLQIVGTPITQEYYGFAAHPSSVSLVAAIDAHLRAMKNSGELKTIVDSWVGKQ